MVRSSRRRQKKSFTITWQRTLLAVSLLVIVSASMVLFYNLGVETGVAKSSSGFNSVALYANSQRGVVTIQGEQVSLMDTNFGPQNASQAVLGSGFVIRYRDSNYIVTNFHVIDGMVNATVTFWDYDTYGARVVATDPYSDLALLSTPAPTSEFYPLQLASSSTLEVGDAVVAIGNPFGYSGTITSGIVSQLGRSIQYASATGNVTFPVADVIQFSAPINPGNSGGPLINEKGMVVGVTAAVIAGSQGLGFAVPADTLLRELPSLANTGAYAMHSYLGVETVDMTYELSQLIQSKVTYGVLIEKAIHHGPADIAGLRGGTNEVDVTGQPYIVGGDVIISINGVRIVNNDALSTYLERYTHPGETIQIEVIRSGNHLTFQVTLGTRPPPSVA